MDVVGVKAAYFNPMFVCVCVCVVHCLEGHLSAFLGSELKYATITPTTSMSTDTIQRTILVILAKHCTRLPDDGSSVIRNMLGVHLNIL